MAEQGNLFILSAPSGAGKSSLISALLKQDSSRVMQLSVSHTTRQPRPGEVDGQHYHFVTVEQFEQSVSEGAFYEYAKVFDNYYGTSVQAIDEQLAKGIDVFLDIDWQGAQQVRKKKPDVTSIFIAPPSKQELERRLTNRGQDSAEVIAGRMAKAQAECSHYDEFDYIIVNDDFDQALIDFTTIVNNQRLTREQQTRKHAELFKDLVSE
ncbi:guanylate kinase [Endozoicomonas sp. G2_1]|uniref:guanylate kinase n=1 Tax=Endozoicomonas sp. G2_1 TaxID=2821091 RepID=UPI001ADAC829|nr:guanylate kinase [Endozoicomonas sp. G2_1]